METKERTVETIKQEFMQLCADAGNLAYQIKCYEGDLNQKYQKMSELNKEAAELDKKGKEHAA
jgi:hypothetical protein